MFLTTATLSSSRKSVRVPHRGLSPAHHQPQLGGQRPGGALQHAGPGAQRRLHRPGHVPRRHEGVDRRLPQQRVPEGRRRAHVELQTSFLATDLDEGFSRFSKHSFPQTLVSFDR